MKTPKSPAREMQRPIKKGRLLAVYQSDVSGLIYTTISPEEDYDLHLIGMRRIWAIEPDAGFKNIGWVNHSGEAWVKGKAYRNIGQARAAAMMGRLK